MMMMMDNDDDDYDDNNDDDSLFDSVDYLEAAACIISTAQQANPNVIGHIEPRG